MFWNEKVAISEDINEACSPAMGVCRIMGLFPVGIERNGSKWVLKWSGAFAFYSYVLGIILLTATYAGFVGDVMAEKGKSIRIKASTDIYITFFDISVVELVVIFGIFITPFRFKTFCSYVECINEADSILNLTDSKRARKISIMTLTIILITTAIVLVADMFVYFRIDGERTSEEFIAKSYTGFYVTHFLMMMTHYQLWHLGYCVLRRLKRLNEHLEAEGGTDGDTLKIKSAGNNNVYPVLSNNYPFNVANYDAKNIGRTLDTMKANGTMRPITPTNTDEKKPPSLVDDERILKLMRAYLRLCDAVEIQNQLLGFVGAILITGILLQLILSTYGLFVELAGNRQDPFYALIKSVWCVVHLVRLFMIVEPSHACTVESQNTKDLVCKLLCSNITEQTKIQLDAFAMALFHRKIEFFASGLAAVDRSLVTSVIGAITTYLVILLQFVKPE